MSGPRYAIYYAPPPGAPLWSFGSSVLGYDAATGERTPLLVPPGIETGDWEAMTAQPRRYGFHATLKAPFRLADGASEDDLIESGKAFARSRRPFDLPPLKIAEIEGFVALIPAEPSAPLEDLAAACVERFEPFRARPTAAELARRLAAPLTERQRASLERWGYPYVFEDFRFHMTLTGQLPETVVPGVVDGLTELYGTRAGEVGNLVDAVTLYVEDDPAVGFRIVDRFVFGAG